MKMSFHGSNSPARRLLIEFWTLMLMKKMAVHGRKKLCNGAVRLGHLEVLKYAVENDCLWDKDTCLYWAATYGGVEVLEYWQYLAS